MTKGIVPVGKVASRMKTESALHAALKVLFLLPSAWGSPMIFREWEDKAS